MPNGVHDDVIITANVFPFSCHTNPETVSLPLYVHVNVNDSPSAAIAGDGDNTTLPLARRKPVKV